MTKVKYILLLVVSGLILTLLCKNIFKENECATSCKKIGAKSFVEKEDGCYCIYLTHSEEDI